MTKLTRSEQARINGSKSRGPVTPEGKARSARNATKHGHYAKPGKAAFQVICLRNEDRSAFDNLLARRTQDLLPVNSFESSLVTEIAAIEWKMARILAAETRSLDHQMALESDTVRRESGSLRGITPIDILAFSFAKVLESSPVLPFCAREFTRLQKARREALNTLIALRKNFRTFEQSKEPAICEQLDLWNEPDEPSPAPAPAEAKTEPETEPGIGPEATPGTSAANRADGEPSPASQPVSPQPISIRPTTYQCPTHPWLGTPEDDSSEDDGEDQGPFERRPAA